MKNKDKKFPIILLILFIVATFGIFLIGSFSATITGATIGAGFSSWTIMWIALIIIAIFVGMSILHEK